MVGFLGGWIISSSRGTGLLFAFLFSSGFGMLVSLLKVALSNSVFASKSNNKIIITPKAILINDNFKTISDHTIQLQYVKAIKQHEHNLIEFSLGWQTRSSFTNDQLRIYVPLRYQMEIHTIVNFTGRR